MHFLIYWIICISVSVHHIFHEQVNCGRLTFSVKKIGLYVEVNIGTVCERIVSQLSG